MKLDTRKTAGLAVALAFTVIAAGCGGEKKGEVLAEVGKDTITSTEFEAALANLPRSYRLLTVNYSGKRKILDNLVKKRLLVQEARRRGYHKLPGVKQKIEELKERSTARLRAEMRELKARLKRLDREAYENVLLQELNVRFNEEKAKSAEVSDVDVKNYYEDYVKKLKVLNPNAKIPRLKEVRDQIKAILVEEKLLQNLEKASDVQIHEDIFKRLYQEGKDVTIKESGNR